MEWSLRTTSKRGQIKIPEALSMGEDILMNTEGFTSMTPVSCRLATCSAEHAYLSSWDVTILGVL